MMLTSCPGCGEPAEVLDHFELPSTDGPVEHARTYCVNRHWFLAPVTDSRAVGHQSQVTIASGRNRP